MPEYVISELCGPPGPAEASLLCEANAATGHRWIWALAPGDMADAAARFDAQWWVRFGIFDAGGELVAHAGVHATDGDTPAGVTDGAGEFARAMVHPDHQGLGLARALSDACRSWATTARRDLWLCVLDENGASDVWGACGWVTVGGYPAPASRRWLHVMVPDPTRPTVAPTRVLARRP